METVTRSSAAQWLDLFERTPGGLPMQIQERGVRPITVPRASAKKVLKGLAADLNEIDFSVDDPNYPGAVRLSSISNSEDEFDFSFKTFLGECTDPNCPHPRGVISQREWDQCHYSRGCKSLKTHYRSTRARILLTRDSASLIDRVSGTCKTCGPYLYAVADSCFRPIADEMGELRDPIKLSEALLQSYAGIFRELLAERGTGKEND
jgi:hypothetical protein